MEWVRVCVRLIYVLLCTCQTAELSGPPSPNRHRNATAVEGPLCRPWDPWYTSGTTEHTERGLEGFALVGGGGGGGGGGGELPSLLLCFFFFSIFIQRRFVHFVSHSPSLSTSVFSSSLPLYCHLKLNFTTSARSQRNNLTGSGALACRLEVPVACFHIKLLSTVSGVSSVWSWSHGKSVVWSKRNACYSKHAGVEEKKNTWPKPYVLPF